MKTSYLYSTAVLLLNRRRCCDCTVARRFSKARGTPRPNSRRPVAGGALKGNGSPGRG